MLGALAVLTHDGRPAGTDWAGAFTLSRAAVAWKRYL
jgi:hypothetical protein